MLQVLLVKKIKIDHTVTMLQNTNQLILGDNLQILKSLPAESVDLIYIDPPFFSNRNYEVIWGDDGEMRSFTDRWAGGMEHYIGWLYERVEQMYRLLKPTGSLYLHCDWHADAYIRVQILDKIFGSKNFLSAIDWCYEDVGGKATRYFKRKKDTIFLYQKSDSKARVFNQQLKSLSDSTIKRFNKYFDGNGQITYEALQKSNPGVFAKLKGVPSNLSKVWLDINQGQPLSDWWIDLSAIKRGFNESIGYPTQKPEALLERIIKASSNEGDMVMDAFCGGGTTLAVADKLNRHWIGVDQSVQAIKVSEQRLANQRNLFQQPFSVKLHKYDYDTLRYSNAFLSEKWIVEQFGGEANAKQRGDLGIDGHKENIAIQVKRSDNVGRNVIDNFKSAIGRYSSGKAVKATSDIAGYLIAFSFGKGAYEEVARLKNEENIQIKLLKVDDIVAIAEKPAINLAMVSAERNGKDQWEITFKAESTEKIEIYQWDFNYTDNQFTTASKTMWDKEGQQKQIFPCRGSYTVACKGIDTNGIEAIAKLDIKVNGNVERL